MFQESKAPGIMPLSMFLSNIIKLSVSWKVKQATNLMQFIFSRLLFRITFRQRMCQGTGSKLSPRNWCVTESWLCLSPAERTASGKIYRTSKGEAPDPFPLMGWKHCQEIPLLKTLIPWHKGDKDSLDPNARHLQFGETNILPSTGHLTSWQCFALWRIKITS